MAFLRQSCAEPGLLFLPCAVGLWHSHLGGWVPRAMLLFLSIHIGSVHLLLHTDLLKNSSV